MQPTLNQGKCVVKRHSAFFTRLTSMKIVCQWEIKLEGQIGSSRRSLQDN